MCEQHNLLEGGPVVPHGRAVFVIVPCFNEGEVQRRTVEDLLSLGVSVVIVDDGSTVAASTYCAQLPVHLLRHSINLGQGAALQTGMDYAIGQGAEIIIHFDADGQHDPWVIPGMVEMLRAGGVDIILGSRFLDASHTKAVPWAKRLVLRVGVFISWLFSGLWLTDAHNGLRAMTCAAASKIRLTENGFGHATEILGEIRREHLRYRELATLVRYTDYSQHKGQRVTNGFNLVIDLLLRKIVR